MIIIPKKLCTAAIKKQWGENLGKFEGMQLPGGVTLNGRQLLMMQRKKWKEK